MAERCASYRDMTENTTDKNKNTHIVCKVFSLLSLNEATRYVRADFNNHLPKEKKKKGKSQRARLGQTAHMWQNVIKHAPLSSPSPGLDL